MTYAPLFVVLVVEVAALVTVLAATRRDESHRQSKARHPSAGIDARFTATTHSDPP